MERRNVMAIKPRCIGGRFLRSIAAMLLVVCICLGMFPVTAFASEISDMDQAVTAVGTWGADDGAVTDDGSVLIRDAHMTMAVSNDEDIESSSVDFNGDINMVVNIIWEDDDESMRPDSVSVQLMRDGKNTGDPAIVTAADDWRYVWSDLGENHVFNARLVKSPFGYTTRVTIDSESSTDGDEYTVCNIINTYVGDIYVDVIANVIWVDDDESRRPYMIDLNLLETGHLQERQGYLTAESGWSCKWPDLDGRYVWSVAPQSGVPKGYTASITTESKIVDGRRQLIYNITYVYIGVQTTDVTVKMVWENDDESQRPSSVDAALGYRPGSYVEYLQTERVTLSADDDWTYTWTDRDSSYIYAVGLVSALEGYSSIVTVDFDGTADKGHAIYNIVNTYDEALTSIDMAVHVDWENDVESQRPKNLKFGYFRNMENTWFYQYPSSTNGWSVTNSNCDAKYVWFPYQMDMLPSGYYTSRITTDVDSVDSSRKIVAYDITNGYEKPATTDMTVKVTWMDDTTANRPSSINVNILRNDQIFRTIQLGEWRDWSQTLRGLDNKYVWTACLADSVPSGYASECHVDSETTEDMNKHVTCNIENVYTGTEFVGSTDMTIKCLWVDDDASKRPSSVRLQVVRVDVWGGSVDVYGSRNWTWTDTYTTYDTFCSVQLDGFPPAGYAADIHVESDVVSNTKQSVTCTVVFTYIGETERVDAVVDVSWLDCSYDRPESVAVRLMCDGADYLPDSSVYYWRLTEKNGWTHTWEGLDGRYTWCVRLVDSLEGYDTEIVNTTRSVDKDGVMTKQSVSTVVNTPEAFIPETASVIATVVWSDKDAGNRPDSVRVKLVCDGEEYDGEDAVVYLTADNDWTYEWAELDGRHEWSAHTVDPSPDGYTTSHATKAYAVDAGEGLHGYVVCNISNVNEDVIEYEWHWSGEFITGSHVDAFAVKKVWFGGDESRLDSVGVTLVDSSWDARREDVVLDGGSWWSHIWYGIGTSYEYLSIEEHTPGSYVSKVMYNGTACVVANIPGVSDEIIGGFALPNTGGTGIVNLMLIGVVLAASSTVVLIANRRRDRRDG